MSVALSEDWRRQVEKRLQTLELRNAVEEVHRTSVEKRLGGIEDTLRWLVRLIIGALLMGALGYLLAGGIKPA